MNHHFEKTAIGPDHELSSELEQSLQSNPQARDARYTLEKSNSQMSLVRCSHTPRAVLDATALITKSQPGADASSWLRPLIESGVEPVVKGSDGVSALKLIEQFGRYALSVEVQGAEGDDKRIAHILNDAIRPEATRYAVHRLIEDTASRPSAS